MKTLSDLLDARSAKHEARNVRVEFFTGEYVHAHGHAPRGRGSWAFQFHDSDEPRFAPGSLTYGEAKTWAREQARLWAHSIGATIVAVTVCS